MIKSVYDTIIMITTKLLKHRLSLERWLEAKRNSSRLAGALLSRMTLLGLVGTAVLLLLEPVLAELIGAALLGTIACARATTILPSH